MLRRRVSDLEGAKTKNQFTSRVTDLEDTFLRAIHCTLHCRGTRFTNPKKQLGRIFFLYVAVPFRVVSGLQ